MKELDDKVLRITVVAIFAFALLELLLDGVYTRALIKEMADKHSLEIARVESLARYPIARDSALLSEDKDLRRSLAELLAKTGLANKPAEGGSQ